MSYTTSLYPRRVPAGPVGATGSAGSKGTQGAQGTQGLKGATGANGLQTTAVYFDTSIGTRTFKSTKSRALTPTFINMSFTSTSLNTSYEYTPTIVGDNVITYPNPDYIAGDPQFATPEGLLFYLNQLYELHFKICLITKYLKNKNKKIENYL